ncbi:MAG: hypothetical protein Kow00129_14590 [Thermoleophilia bacterium]
MQAAVRRQGGPENDDRPGRPAECKRGDRSDRGAERRLRLVGWDELADLDTSRLKRDGSDEPGRQHSQQSLGAYLAGLVAGSACPICEEGRMVPEAFSGPQPEALTCPECGARIERRPAA